MAFLVYRASAGSGKTYTLVRTYLALALSGDDAAHFKHILAITFTNKAAQEMKSRIIAALAEISGQAEGDRYQSMAKDLSQQLDLSPTALKYRAGRVFQAILHRYQDFSISTIDAFVARIGRSFARDLRLQQGFEILLDQQEIKQQTVDLLLSRLGEDAALTETLVAFALEQTADDKSWDIRNALLGYCQELFKDESRAYLPLLAQINPAQLKTARQELHQRMAMFDAILRTSGEAATQIIVASGLEVGCFAGGVSGINGFFIKCAEGKFEGISAYANKAYSADKWAGSKLKKTEAATLEATADQLRPHLAKIVKTVEEQWPEYKLYLAIRNSLYATATLGQLQEAVAIVLEEQQATTLNELYHRIGILLADAATPFIYERLGNRYQHFLIDEFQDTSLVQWQNLAPLVDNGLSANYPSLLVGDAKQAIYRWRSGEAGQFVNLPEPFGQQPAYTSFYNAFELHTLADNYRSGAEIVQFNNLFFRKWAGLLPEHHQLNYDALEQNPKRSGGYVEVHLLEKINKAQESLDHRIDLIIAKIQELLLLGFAAGDMAVLVRTNRTGSAVAARLLQAELPVVSADSLLLGSHKDVQFIVQLIRWLYKNDKIAESAIKLRLLPTDQLATITLTGLLLQKQPDWKRHHWLALPLYELAEKLLDFFELNDVADPFLSTLLDQLHQFGQQMDATVDAWLAWWDAKGLSTAITLPEGLNAIQVMTIHKAKGLEFPVVFLPETESSSSKLGVSSSWISPPATIDLPVAYVGLAQLKEAPPAYAALYEAEQQKTQIDIINNVYVAFTRASEALFVYGEQPKETRKASILGFSAVFQIFAGESQSAASSYTYGTLPTGYISRLGKAAATAPGSHPYSAWREHLRLSTRFRAAETQEDHPALRRGRLAHQLLAKLHHREDLAQLISSAIEDGSLTAEEARPLETSLIDVLYQAKLAPYFDPAGIILNESAILGPATHLRPDRVVLVGDEARVLEYKTGRPSAEHVIQLNVYLDLLSQMGYQAIGQLLYLDLEE